jgi:CHAT domain-containing protein/predicted Zn-dependent protease
MSPDAHAPWVNKLVQQEDWAGLVRYWIAHQHKPALDAAIACARACAARNSRWKQLPGYLEQVKANPPTEVLFGYGNDVVVKANRPPKGLPAPANEAEHAALGILPLWPLVGLCERAEQYPLEQQNRLFQLGLESAELAAGLALGCQDAPLAAFLLRVRARGFQEVRQWEQALPIYGQALHSYRELARQRPEVYRPDVALTLNNLGIVQYDLNALEAARASFEEAVAIRRELARARPEVYEPLVASTLNNLGNAQRASNELEAALCSYEEALGIYRELSRARPQVYRPYVAITLNALGTIQGALNELEAARASHTEALEIRRKLAQQRPEIYRPDVAQTLNNLGNVQRDLNELKAARASHEEGLEIYRELARQRPEVYRPDVAMTLNNLGNVQRDLNELKAARASYEEALGIYRELSRARPQVYRPYVAITLNNLGTIQAAFNELKAARASFEEAASLHEAGAQLHSDVWLVERQDAHGNLGLLVRRQDVYLGWPDYRAAREHLGLACRCAERFRGKFRDERERRRVAEESYQLFELHVRNCMDVWDVSMVDQAPDVSALREAVWAAEASHSRQLLDRLERQELQPALAPAGLEETFRQHGREIELIRRRFDGGHGGGWLSAPDRRLNFGADAPAGAIAPVASVEIERLNKLERERARVLDEILRYDPGFQPDGVKVRDCGEIQRLTPQDRPTAFVQFALGREASFAFILTRDAVRPVRLPGFTSQVAWELADEWFREYARLQNEYEAERRNPTRAWPAFVRFVQAWGAVVERLLARVSELALAPVLAELPSEIERLVISPHQALHVLPLHACPMPGKVGRLVSDEPGNGTGSQTASGSAGTLRPTLGDTFEICYTPSFSMLHHCARPATNANSPEHDHAEFLLAENPTGDLLFTQVEGAALRRRFQARGSVNSMQRDAVQKDALRAGVLDCRVFHYSGHAGFNGREPLDSALLLSGEPWTLAEVFTRVRLRRNELTVLNGCESGLLIPDVLDDYHNFTTGFLFAGSRCVVTTLWAIPDLPSALLMDKFHERWLDGEAPAAALRHAQEFMRGLRAGGNFRGAIEKFISHLDDAELALVCREQASRFVAAFGETPFASPVHWAAFTCNGLGFPPASAKAGNS